MIWVMPVKVCATRCVTYIVTGDDIIYFHFRTLRLCHHTGVHCILLSILYSIAFDYSEIWTFVKSGICICFWFKICFSLIYEINWPSFSYFLISISLYISWKVFWRFKLFTHFSWHFVWQEMKSKFNMEIEHQSLEWVIFYFENVHVK